MRLSPLFAMTLAACGPNGEDSDPTTNRSLEMVEPYRGDPDNYTPSGFAKHVYPIRNCKFEMQLEPPFQVAEDDHGPTIRVPLQFLDDRSVKEIAKDGIDDQARVSFNFPSRYWGEGLKNWFAKSVKSGAPEPLPLAALSVSLKSPGSRKRDGTDGETKYLGKLADGREVALFCSATDWPNPLCEAEVPVTAGGQMYLVGFPPAVASKLARIVEIGDALFAEAAAACGG